MNDPNLRVAGQLQYELKAGQSVDILILPDFTSALKAALQTADSNHPTRVRLMFEVEQ